jgi:tryptophan synthase beta chain
MAATASITTAAAATTKPQSSSSSLLKPYSSSQLPIKFSKFSTSRAPSRFAISCTLAREAEVKMEEVADSDPALWQRPDSFGRFGKYGGKYVPETLMYALTELESAFYSFKDDPEFKVSLPIYTYIGPCIYIAFLGLFDFAEKECLFHFLFSVPIIYRKG